MSLKRIYLRDFVIVRELELELAGGFTVLTGETGAGKSILIDALQLALGARADAAVVREGAERCEISVAFSCTAPLLAWLEDKGLPIEDDLLLRRCGRRRWLLLVRRWCWWCLWRSVRALSRMLLRRLRRSSRCDG